MNRNDRIFRLEQQMVDPKDWFQKVPLHIIEMFQDDIVDGYPVGFAHDEELGWCVLMCGQGPFVAYCERDEAR